MPRRGMSRGGSGVVSRPSYSMLPRAGLMEPGVMLMKVVFAAPLVPISPTTESCSIAALTSFAAVTAPKDLFNPLASSITGTGAQFRRYGPDSLGQEHDEQQERDAEAHLPGVGREVVGHGVDRAVDQRTREGSEHGARAGENGGEDELPRGGPQSPRGGGGPEGGGGRAAPRPAASR